MRYVFALVTLLYAAATMGATHAERLAELNNDPDVLEAVLETSFAPIPGTTALYKASYRYVAVDGDTVIDNTVAVIAYDFGGPAEAVYWLRRTPDVLTNTPPEKLISARTASGWSALTVAQQSTAIENFSNEVYQAANAGAGDIREFSVSAVSGDTVKVSGYFDLGTTWEQQTWYVRLIDPNGSVNAPYSNVEFQRIVEQAAP